MPSNTHSMQSQNQFQPLMILKFVVCALRYIHLNLSSGFYQYGCPCSNLQESVDCQQMAFHSSPPFSSGSFCNSRTTSSRVHPSSVTKALYRSAADVPLETCKFRSMKSITCKVVLVSDCKDTPTRLRPHENLHDYMLHLPLR